VHGSSRSLRSLVVGARFLRVAARVLSDDLASCTELLLLLLHRERRVARLMISFDECSKAHSRI
jgi:hypothetical protein